MLTCLNRASGTQYRPLTDLMQTIVLLLTLIDRRVNQVASLTTVALKICNEREE